MLGRVARRYAWTGGAAAMVLLWTGCTTMVEAPGAAAAVAPQLSVERFLQAANARDLDAMARIFGTAQGPIGDTGSTFACFWKKIGSWFGGESCMKRTDVELRLDAIAQLLRHEDYVIARDEPVAGRRNATRRVFVDLRQRTGTATGLPFEVVRTSDGRWLVESVALERLTGEVGTGNSRRPTR